MRALNEWMQTKGVTQKELAKVLGVTQGAISQWRTKGAIPLARVPTLAKLTGIPLSRLRPDVFEVA